MNGDFHGYLMVHYFSHGLLQAQISELNGAHSTRLFSCNEGVMCSYQGGLHRS
jgi:hypothetical protein